MEKIAQINIGTTADDGTGDTARAAAVKMNEAITGELSVIGTPVYSDLQVLHNILNSSGLLDGGGFSANSDGSIKVAALSGLIRASDDHTSILYPFDLSELASLSLTNTVLNYVYVEYNAGSPQIIATATKRADRHSNVFLGTSYRNGNELHNTTAGKQQISNAIGGLIERLQATESFLHASGAALSATGTRNIACSLGSFYEALNPISTIAQDTSGVTPNNHTFEYFYYNGSAWITHESNVSVVVFTGSGLDDATSGGLFIGSHTQNIVVEIEGTGSPDTFKYTYKDNNGVDNVEATGVAITGSAQVLVDDVSITFAATTGHTIGDKWAIDATLSSQIDNTQYNNTVSGLATLSNNNYGIHWIYLDIHGHLAILFGQDSYSGLVSAQDASPPSSVPAELIGHARLIGRVIIKKSAAAFISIDNNYGEAFQASVATSHSGLTDINADDHSKTFITLGSSAAVAIGAENSQKIIISGTATITSFGTANNGVKREIIASGAFTLTNNTNIRVQGGADYIAEIGDLIQCFSDGTNWDIFIQKASGNSVADILKNNCVGWVTFNGTGSLSILDSSGIISSVSDLGAGSYQVNFSQDMANTSYAVSMAAKVSASWSNAGNNVDSKAVGSVTVTTIEGTVPTDSPLVDVLIFGELA